jgi:hypothetical protein
MRRWTFHDLKFFSQHGILRFMNLEEKQKTVAELARHVGGQVFGDDSVLISRVASLESAVEGEIAFVEDRKLLEEARHSRASCLLVPPGANLDQRCRIETSRPKLAFALVAELLHAPARPQPFIHPSASVAASAIIDETVLIGAHASPRGDRHRRRSKYWTRLHHLSERGDLRRRDAGRARAPPRGRRRRSGRLRLRARRK